MKVIELFDLVVAEPQFLESSCDFLEALDSFDLVSGEGQSGDVLQRGEVYDFIDAVG